jgi:hypothetical protein
MIVPGSTLVTTYLIDFVLLNPLLSDDTISRSIYDKITVHMIMNNYQKSFYLTHSQLKMLLNKKSDIL